MMNEKNLKTYLIISLISLTTAILFFCFYNELIIFKNPYNKQLENVTTTPSLCKKEVTLHYFHHEKWNSEKQTLLWTDNIIKNTHQLVNAWLTLLEEEHIFTKKITLQTALLSPANVLYLSFDHNFLAKENSIFNKWMLIEGLFKTMQNNNVSVQAIQLLVQHQQLNDSHIDFSQPWPMQGFLIL